MKKLYAILFLTGINLFVNPTFGASSISAKYAAVHETNAATVVKTVNAERKEMNLKQKRAKKKAIKSELKKAINKGSDTETLVLIIITILLHNRFCAFASER